MLQSFSQDLVLGFRSLRKNPLFCFIAIVTLALGIGANTAIFSLLYGLLLRSLPVASPTQLVRVGFSSPGFNNGGRPIYLPFRTLQLLRVEQKSFTDISAWDEGRTAVPDSEGRLHFYSSALVSGNAFSTLGLTPYLGRFLAPYDDVRGGPPHGWAVVVSYGFWSDYFGKDVGVLGRRLKLGDAEATVVGVAPPEFHGIWSGQETKIYLPLQFASRNPAQDRLNDSNSIFGIVAVGRLKPGVRGSRLKRNSLHCRKICSSIPFQRVSNATRSSRRFL